MSTVVRPTTTEATGECARCRRHGVPAAMWRAAWPDERDRWRSLRMVRLEARGLCQTCYRWATERGRLADYPRTKVSTADVLEEWEHLADPLRPLAEEVARLAPRLGMPEQTLRSALWRAGIRSRYTGGPGERARDAA